MTRLIGGLGNQLFQYSIARHLALLNDADLKLDVTSFQLYKLHHYALQHFAIRARVAGPRERRRYVPVEESNGSIFSQRARHLLARPFSRRAGIYMKESGLSFDEQALIRRGSVYLEGYWQSERYFSDIAGVIREDLRVVTPPSKANIEMAKRISEQPSASVHVRLGDYASDCHTQEVHGLTPISFYGAAVSQLMDQVPDIRFFLFSDDPITARERVALPENQSVVVDINGPLTNYEDLRLMARCDHHVIANSTFSWWGAWLGETKDSVIIAPKRWFRDSRLPDADIVPVRWTRL